MLTATPAGLLAQETEIVENNIDLATTVYRGGGIGTRTIQWPDETTTTGIRTNGWGRVYVGRYDMAKVKKILVRTNIKSHYQYCYGLKAYVVPTSASAAAITSEDQLAAFTETESNRIGTFYGDETIDGNALDKNMPSNTWKVGPQYCIDLEAQTITVDEDDFKAKWGDGAVATLTGYTYNDEEKTDVKATYNSAFNTGFTATTGVADIFFSFGAAKWGQMVVDEIIVVAEKEDEPEEPVETDTYTLQPVKDMQLRIGNSNQSGTGAAIEVRENTANNHEYGFCGIIEFDLTAIQQKIAEGYTISDAYLRLTDASNNASSNLVLKPFYSGWAEDKATTYDKNVEAVTAAAAADALATLQLKRYGGKKAFELQNAATHVNPFPVSAYQGTSISNEALIAYLTDSLSAGKTAVSLLVGREDGSTFGAGFYSKDVLNGLNDTKNCAQYEWSETDQKWVKIEGTDNSISRIAAAMQFFGLTEAEFQAECAPLLTITLQEPNPAEAEYYVVGKMTDWQVNDGYKMTLNTAAETTEYTFTIDLTTESQIKVVKVEGENQTWYPDGEGNSYGENGEITADGEYTVYFRPNADGGEDWFYNVIYVMPNFEPQPEEAEYYIVGNMTDWQVNEEYKMTLNEEAETEEYTFTIDLTTESQLKVVKVDGESQTWYPDGEGNNYGENGEITADGQYTVYFRPNADGGDDWFYNVIYVAAFSEPQPEEGVAYILTQEWDGTKLYFDLPAEEGATPKLSETESQVVLVPKGDKYVMTTADGAFYLAYTGSNNWDLIATATAENAAELEVTIADGKMTINAANGYLAINNKNAIAAGEPIYGDGNPSKHKTNFNHEWNIEENTTTAISQMENRQIVNCKYFDLQGRPVNGQLTKGLYIVNGKKVIVR